MAFEYKERSVETWERQANQRANEFTGFIQDGIKVYKVRAGENYIRILPPTFPDAQHYGLEVHVHNNIGTEKAQVLCLKHMLGESCPACNTRAQAERSGDEELVKELRPQKRYVVWILDRKDIEKGVQLWSMPQTVDRDICKISRDRQTQEIYHIDHPYQGYDISFDKEGEKILTKYVGFQLARRPSSVDEQYLEYITRYPLNEILIWRDATEIQGFLDGANGGKSGASAPAPDTRREPPRQTAQERPVDRLPPPREEAPAARREPPSEPVAVRSEPAPARREAPPFADPDQEFLNKLTTPEPQTAPSTAPNTPPPNRPTTIDKPPISDRARQLAERFAARQSGG